MVVTYHCFPSTPTHLGQVEVNEVRMPFTISILLGPEYDIIFADIPMNVAGAAKIIEN